jgi:hypothetical protein
MSGATHPLPQYAFMALCSIKKAQGQLYLYLLLQEFEIPLFGMFSIVSVRSARNSN